MASTSTYVVGDARITRVSEHLIEMPAEKLFPDHQAELAAADVQGNLALSIHTWIVRMPGRLIVIDTGIGNDRDRDGSPLFDHLHTEFEARLAAAGVDREAVDTVVMTHLHNDHVGWNTHREGGRWRPMFPNARYIFSARELHEWLHDPKRRAILADSVQPILDAGLAAPFDAAHPADLGDGLSQLATPGHTPDHASIVLTSAGHHALFGGDVMHSALQVEYPHWNSTFCEDRPRATLSRQRVLAWCVEHDALYFSTHFANTSAGRIARLESDPSRYTCIFL
jgi:glyoxylase-like metal-dependent hydrolase (beta-lactamase superfamily II)